MAPKGLHFSVQFLTQGPTLLAIPMEGDGGGGGGKGYMWDPLVNPMSLCVGHTQGLSVVLRFLCVSQVYLNAAASLIMVRNMYIYNGKFTYNMTTNQDNFFFSFQLYMYCTRSFVMPGWSAFVTVCGDKQPEQQY